MSQLNVDAISHTGNTTTFPNIELNSDGLAKFSLQLKPVTIGEGGYRRNHLRPNRFYGANTAGFQMEGANNSDARLGLCRNGGGGAPSVLCAVTGPYTADPGDPIEYPLTPGTNQSLMTLAAYGADDYQLVQAARIQARTVGAVTAGTAVGSEGIAVGEITFNTTDSSGNQDNRVELTAADGLKLVNGTKINFDSLSSTFEYEEGSWSPEVLIAESTTVIPGTQAAFYTRSGRNVFVIARIQNVDRAGATGKLEISNLPFQISNNAGGSVSDQGTGQVTLWNADGSKTIYGTPIVRTNRNTTTCYISYMNDTTFENSSNAFQTAQVEDLFETTGSQLRIALTYICSPQ